MGGKQADQIWSGFQKLEKMKDSNRQSRQLEELAEKMRQCKRLIKDFDREVKDLAYKSDPDTNKMLTEKKQSMIKELNSYVALEKHNLENKRVDVFEGPAIGFAEDNVLLASNPKVVLVQILLGCRSGNVIEQVQPHL